MELEIVCPCWCPQAESIDLGLPILSRQGVTAVEIGLHAFPNYFDFRDLDAVNRLITSLDASSISVHSIHAQMGASVDFSSFDDKVHERGVEAQIQAMELAKLLGARMVVTHASDAGVTTGRQRRMDRARGVIRELASVAQESGLILAIENLPPGFLGCTAEEVAWLIEQSRSEWVAACFDTGHANLTPGFQRSAQRLLSLAVTTHLHDNDGIDDQHKFPGQGSIDWAEFGRLYRDSGSIAQLVMECPPPEDMIWRDGFRLFRDQIGC